MFSSVWFHSVISSILIPWFDSHGLCFLLQFCITHYSPLCSFFILTLPVTLFSSFMLPNCQQNSLQYWGRWSFLLSDMIEGGITGKPCVLPVPPEWKHQFNQFWGNRYPVQNRYSKVFSWLLLTNVYREHTFFLSLVTQPYFRSLCRRVKTSNWSYQTAPKQGAGIAEIV